MAYSIRVSLPGYNALTDTNPDHFALISDSNDILIKEYTRGTITVPGQTTVSITHNLGYVPFSVVFLSLDNNYKTYIFGFYSYYYDRLYTNTTKIVINNTSSSNRIYSYYIFYDNII